MLQVYADKNGPILDKKPDPNMRIKVKAEKLSLSHMQIKLANQLEGLNPGKKWQHYINLHVLMKAIAERGRYESFFFFLGLLVSINTMTQLIYSLA